MAVALLLTATPAGVATAATGPRACKVLNLDQGIGRGSLQRAVWAAEPGDRLVVQGTCVGTTLIRKDLTIAWQEVGSITACDAQGRCRTVGRGSGTPVVRGSRGGPAIVVDPRVEGFRIVPGLRIQGGIVVEPIRDWKRGLAPATVRAAVQPAAEATGLRSCSVSNQRTDERYDQLQQAVDQAVGGDSLLFRGKCSGRTVIDKPISITGFRIAISSITCGRHGCTEPVADDSGVPIVSSVTVRAGVEGVSLRRLTVPRGFVVE